MTGGGNGRHHSLETRQKMTETRTGKTHADITKQKIGKKHKGKKVDEITKEKIGNGSRYRNMKTEHKEKIERLLAEQNIEHLPMYINYLTDNQRQSDGFVVRIPKHTKKFMSKLLTLTQKYILATQYKQSIISNQRLSV